MSCVQNRSAPFSLYKNMETIETIVDDVSGRFTDGNEHPGGGGGGAWGVRWELCTFSSTLLGI